MHYVAPRKSLDRFRKGIFGNTKKMVISMLAFIDILSLLGIQDPYNLFCCP